jgi:hypothetical protein
MQLQNGELQKEAVMFWCCYLTVQVVKWSITSQINSEIYRTAHLQIVPAIENSAKLQDIKTA